MNTEGLAKGVEAINGVTSAIYTFIHADGDAMAIAGGVIDLVNAIAVFLPPPASMITETISSLFNMFTGGGTTDTATLIEDGFEKQAELILEQFEAMKDWTGEALDEQTLEEMTFLAEVGTILWSN